MDFEAFLEASIVFARSAVHRLKTKHEKHPNWKAVWQSWKVEPAVQFFREERDWILKTASAKIGQKIFAGTVGGSQPVRTPSFAGEFYFYHDPKIPATATVEQNLAKLVGLLTEAEEMFR